MKKIITVKSCSSCPHHDSEMPEMMTEGGEYCEHPKFNRPRKISRFNEEIPIIIPRWCPLKESEDIAMECYIIAQACNFGFEAAKTIRKKFKLEI